MSKHRTILTAVALVLLTAISLAAAVQAIVLGIPAPPHPDRLPLVMLLATRDVMEQPEGSRRSLANQLEHELRRDVNWLDEIERLDEAQKALFVENVGELAKVAFLEKVDTYFKIRDERTRERYVDRQFDAILNWAPLVSEKLQRGEQPLLGPAAMTTMVEKINTWYRQADRQQRLRMGTFRTALQQRAFARMQRGMGLNQQ